MNKKTSLTLSAFLLISNFISAMPVSACSFASETYFTYSSHPDLPLKPYAAGQLGILQPAYARSYLHNAYRYLANTPLTSDEQAQIVQMWNSRLTSSDFSCNADAAAWMKARGTVPGAAKIEDIYPDRPVSKEDAYVRYCNCQSSAFNTAAKKLNELCAKHGASSSVVKDWLAAQDQVFSNCGTAPYSDTVLKATIPNALPETAAPDLKMDRDYQIAAANFYSQNFAQATKEFQAIAENANSPWKDIAAYLAIRSMIRQASLSKVIDAKLLETASEAIKRLTENSAFAHLGPDILALKNYISVRITPELHLQELSKEKITSASAAEFTKTIDILIGDQDDGTTDRKYSDLPASVKKPDLVDWIMTFQSSDDSAKKHAIEKWKQTHSAAWLVAAASSIDGKDPNAAAILADIEKNKGGAAQWTLFYEENRLNLENGKKDKVRADLDKVLSKPPADLPLGSLNALKLQRLTLSNNLDEFVKYGVQTPLSTCSNGGTSGVPDDVEQIVSKGKSDDKNTPVITVTAADAISNRMPLSVITQLVNNKQLPLDLKNNIAWTAWVRAVLLGDDAAAKDLAVLMAPLNKAKTKYVDAYLAATTPDARKFAAVFLMLKFSSAQPNVTAGPLQEDNYGDSSGWWWGANPVASYSNSYANDDKDNDPKFDPLFLTAAQRAQAKQQIANLGKVETAPNYLGKAVLAFAKAHPDDVRIPEALHFAVGATHYGSTDDASKVLSKQEFQLLHTRYKTSPWTKKTPFFY